MILIKKEKFQINEKKKISPPSTFMGSLNFSKVKTGKMKRLLFSKLFLILFIK